LILLNIIGRRTERLKQRNPTDVVAVSPKDVKAIVVGSLGQGSHAAQYFPAADPDNEGVNQID
jgi:hypothetical protein